MPQKCPQMGANRNINRAVHKDKSVKLGKKATFLLWALLVPDSKYENEMLPQPVAEEGWSLESSNPSLFAP